MEGLHLVIKSNRKPNTNKAIFKRPKKIKKQDACRFDCSFPLALLKARDFRTAMVHLISMLMALLPQNEHLPIYSTL